MSLFERLVDLPLEVDGYALAPLSAQVSPEMTRHSTLIELRGPGLLVGLGEDVVYEEEAQREFQAAGAVHTEALSGSWTLGTFCEQIEALDLFPSAPERDISRNYRVWAFESAGLDLALLQAGRSLGGALKRAVKPMRYVASLRLGEPPSVDPVLKRLSLDPTLRFKLDATSSWTPELISALVETGAVDSIDFKGLYHGTVVDQGADPELYRRVAAAFPDAWLEDPDLSVPECAAALAGQEQRITWDASIHSIADIEALDVRPQMVNVKPSRVGSLRALMEMYDYLEAHGIGAYGGGQSELGVGRGQAQYLAAIFHPDGPNDLAPAEYNQADPPGGLPTSPLTGDFSRPGFRWPAQ